MWNGSAGVASPVGVKWNPPRVRVLRANSSLRIQPNPLRQCCATRTYRCLIVCCTVRPVSGSTALEVTDFAAVTVSTFFASKSNIVSVPGCYKISKPHSVVESSYCNQCTTSRHRMRTSVTQPLKSRNMYLLFGSIFVFVAGFAAYFKSKHNFSHMISVILYELKYNAVGSKALLADILQAKRNKIDLPKKSGKVAVITGGSRGIGSEVVKMLLECDMEVIIACRSPEAGDKLLCSLRESGITSGSSKVYKLDNSSLESVRKCAELIKRDYKKIDILINNAGIMFTPYSETVDGFEQQWAVNYLSHFLFTSLLMPLLITAGRPGSCSRIINVSSCAHLVGSINFVDINFKENFITSAAYGQSKLAQVMFTKSIQELFSKNNYHVEAYAVHPGLVNTELFDNTYLKKSGEWIMNLMFKNPRQGATPIVYAAVSDALEGRGGMYISNCGPSSVNQEVNNSKIRQNLFEMSLHQTRLKDFLQAS